LGGKVIVKSSISGMVSHSGESSTVKRSKGRRKRSYYKREKKFGVG